MINIDRNALLKDLIAFSQAGSGLAVGNPGVGKSHLLRQLKDAYLEQSNLCFLIKIDNLSDASDRSIQEELGFDDPWIEVFKRIKTNGDWKAVLIFDTFDAARNEQFRKDILKKIKQAKVALSEKWNVLVSVRTYDASKSQQLIQLFPQSEGYTDYTNARKCIIPPLNPDEVTNSISGNSKFELFYNESGQALKEVLRIPFFLVLADTVIQESGQEAIDEIKQFKSETQLLKRFWDLRIRGDFEQTPKERILTQLTIKLISVKSLSVSKKEFLSDISTSDVNAIQALQRDNIIDEVSIGSSRIAFGHNIYFDYAVSVLYLTSNPEEVIHFISEDSSRPFFLRPSFIYFFTQLWYEERHLFWVFFWKLSKQPEKEIQLFVRLIITGVIASEFSTLEDLQPLTDSTANLKIEGARNLLESIRFIRKLALRQDILLLELLSKQPNPLYLWQIGFLLDRAVNGGKLTGELLDRCGYIARNLLAYVIQERNTGNKDFLDRIGSTRGIEMVCKTYYTNVDASKEILQRLFALLTESEFQINYFSNLAEYAKDILPYDPTFVAKIYTELFEHEETSNAETLMGGSMIMSFRSNRRQDFDMVHYRLLEHFPEFLLKAPHIAIPLGLQMANKYTSRSRESSFYQSHPVEIIAFRFKGFDCHYSFDHAAIWLESLQDRESLQLVKTIIDHFKKLSQNDEYGNVRTQLDLFIKEAVIGSTWKMLLEFGIEMLPLLHDYFFDFCTEDHFYTSSDTNFEIGVLIEKGSPYFTNEQIKHIEETIIRVSADANKTITESFTQRYLSRIPVDRLQLEVSKEVLLEKGPVSNEKPYTFTSYSSIYTTKDWLKDKGVDTSDPIIVELLNGEDRLRPFTSEWLNRTPSREVYEPYLKIATELFLRLKEIRHIMDEVVIMNVLREVAQTFSQITRDSSQLTAEEYKVVKEAILYCFQYHSPNDNEQDEKVSSSGIYSPTARTASSEGLGNLAVKENSAEIITILVEAMGDVNAIVRLNASRHLKVLHESHPELYWRIIEERLPVEQDALVASAILSNVYIEIDDQIKANHILNLSYSNEKLFGWQNAFMDSFTLLAIKLWIHRSNARADEIISLAYEREEFQRNVIFKVFKEFKTLSLIEENYSTIYFESAIRWTTIYLKKITEQLTSLVSVEEFNINPKVKSALGLIDEIVLRCYFALERSSRHVGNSIKIPEENRKKIYFYIKPIFERIILTSSEMPNGGFIIGHTAYYFMQSLNACLQFDPSDILRMVHQITELSRQTGLYL